MKSSIQLQKEAAELNAQVQAIVAIAKEENRELSAEEQADVDAILDIKLPAIQADLTRATKIEAMVQANLGRQLDQHIENQNPEQKIRIPATARAGHSFRCFDNSRDGEKDAYISGQFILATLGGNQRAKQWCVDNGVIRNAMAGNDDLKGGALVPMEFEAAIIKRIESTGIFPQYVNRTTMVSDQKTVPRRLAGLTVYFPSEGGTITDSDATYNQVNLVARKAATLSKISSELSEDAAMSIADELAMEIAYAHAVKIDACGFLGDGTTTYGGVMGLDNALAAGAIVTATNTTIGALTLTESEAVLAKLPDYPGMQPVWFMNRSIYFNGPYRLMAAAGGNTTTTLANGLSVPVFHGYPVVFTQALSAAGTTGTTWAFFGDLSLAATMGVRRGVSIASDPSVYFASDQIAVRSTYRWDIVVHEVGTASASGPIVKAKLG